MNCEAGSERADQMLSILLSTHMFIGGVLGCFLDNLIPGHISASCSQYNVKVFLKYNCLGYPEEKG